jgi:hypothetical protein
MEGPGADLQVFGEKDEGGQGLKGQGINSGANAPHTGTSYESTRGKQTNRVVSGSGIYQE